ncbi:MAG: GxxExxY protein [Verrucomicrobia bacterium]|nr:GxxExxY protein [Verrucomicrobiota bacterium]
MFEACTDARKIFIFLAHHAYSPRSNTCTLLEELFLIKSGLCITTEVAEARRKAKKKRCGLIVEKKVIVEMKVVKTLLPIHEAQILTYMRLTGCSIGLLVNFNVPLLRDGLKRFVI